MNKLGEQGWQGKCNKLGEQTRLACAIKGKCNNHLANKAAIRTLIWNMTPHEKSFSVLDQYDFLEFKE